MLLMETFMPEEVREAENSISLTLEFIGFIGGFSLAGTI